MMLFRVPCLNYFNVKPVQRNLTRPEPYFS